ncbi:mucin-2-like [Perca fluviatilis]|uniref:mucin-2-like n=1 Tax=Perca fluviatilis TaxID=8168 RepID=UPI001964E913|nr:mucin-2-like [Perca fluviatilis]
MSSWQENFDIAASWARSHFGWRLSHETVDTVYAKILEALQTKTQANTQPNTQPRGSVIPAAQDRVIEIQAEVEGATQHPRTVLQQNWYDAITARQDAPPTTAIPLPQRQPRIHQQDSRPAQTTGTLLVTADVHQDPTDQAQQTETAGPDDVLDLLNEVPPTPQPVPPPAPQPTPDPTIAAEFPELTKLREEFTAQLQELRTPAAPSERPAASTDEEIPRLEVEISENSDKEDLEEQDPGPSSTLTSIRVTACQPLHPTPISGPHNSASSTEETSIRDTAGQPLHPTPVPGPHNSASSTKLTGQLYSSPVPGPDHSPSSTDETGIRDTAGQPLHPTPVPGPHNYSTSTGPTAGQLLPSTPLPGSPISSTIQVSTVSNCQGCNQLSFRVLQLENLLMAAQTPIRRPSKLPLSAQKGEHVSKATKGENLFERILKDFQKFRLGSRSGKKDTENARQSASHGLRFCLYKASGLPPNAITEDLRFLTQIYKLQAFTAYLSNKGYAPTTIKNMLNNVILFLPHVENSFQKTISLAQKMKINL